MTEHPGVPASERAELTGLQYQAARARDDLHEAVTSLSSAAASRPTLPQLARRRASSAGQRAVGRAWQAVPPDTRAALARPLPRGTKAGAVLGSGLTALLLAAAVVVVIRLRRNR